MFEALDKATLGGEDVDIAKAWAVGFEGWPCWWRA